MGIGTIAVTHLAALPYENVVLLEKVVLLKKGVLIVCRLPVALADIDMDATVLAPVKAARGKNISIFQCNLQPITVNH